MPRHEQKRAFKTLVTGAAGFIGFHVCQRLLRDGHSVVGLDNLSPYYDVSLKQARLNLLATSSNFRFCLRDITDRPSLESIFNGEKPARVVHLAAQAGVRYSVTNPQVCVEANLVGFANILEMCRHHAVEHLVFASSSSVYGANRKIPFSVHDTADHPLSLYAASKKANELMAHSYSDLFRLPTTGLRFFTVYGPWGRPDMAIFLFTQAISAGKPIRLFNRGKMRRDFTYIDDVVEAIVRVLDRAPASDPDWDAAHPDPASSSAPFRIYNLGNHQPVELHRLIELLEKAIGQKAAFEFLPMQPGDVESTYADIQESTRDFGWKPVTSIEQGIPNFVAWYRTFYHG